MLIYDQETFLIIINAENSYAANIFVETIQVKLNYI